jgi:hypothetical protein
MIANMLMWAVLGLLTAWGLICAAGGVFLMGRGAARWSKANPDAARVLVFMGVLTMLLVLGSWIETTGVIASR